MPTTTPVRKRARKSAANSKLGPDQWSEWTDHLATRKRPRSLRDLIDTGRTSALEWPLHADFPGSETSELLRYLDKFKSPKTRGNGELARRLEKWLDDASQRAPTALFAIECLGWAHTLPQLARLLPAAPWCQLQDQLLVTCRDAAGICLTDNPLAQQLLYGELPLTLAYLFPEISQCETLAEPARRALSEGILELLDGEGLINCRFHNTMRPLLASWTRCGCLARSARQPCFEEVSQDQYNWLVRESLRLARYDGSQVLSHDDSGRWSPTLFDAALKLIPRRADSAIARQALPASKNLKGQKEKTSSSPKLPEAAVHSEWAGTALLKRSWSRDDESLVVTYHGQELAWELNRGSVTVWSGKWDFEIEVDGEKLEVTDLWEEVCWVCDKDVSYVEIEAKLSNGWHLQRQLLLGRPDRFLFIADAVLGNQSGHIKYKSTLPLVEGIQFQPAKETREGSLKGGRRLATVLPLALPEWRLPAAGGSLEETDEGLVLSQEADANRLFAPLFVDLDPRRSKKPLTWRQLTVAEQLEIVPADEAVGYRVQIGNEQWLFYRSLGPTGNRTLLGQNYSGEFIAARFIGVGEAEKLIEIE